MSETSSIYRQKKKEKKKEYEIQKNKNKNNIYFHLINKPKAKCIIHP